MPPKKDAEFVYRMEKVLDLYTQPYDPKRPVICMDETPKQLISEVKQPLPMQPGRPLRYEHHYRREGVCNLFLFFEPLVGRRQITVRERRTTRDWIICLKTLVDDWYEKAEVIRIVLDNLSTHNPAAFYEFFTPVEAKRLLDKLEFYYTPKHASWLNMAEIDFSVLCRQCLNRRIPSRQILEQEVTAWVAHRNTRGGTVDWHFTTDDARIRLKRLYPSYSS